MIPLADCKDNLFLCYVPPRTEYVLYSSEDKLVVMKSEKLDDVLACLKL